MAGNLKFTKNVKMIDFARAELVSEVTIFCVCLSHIIFVEDNLTKIEFFKKEKFVLQKRQNHFRGVTKKNSKQVIGFFVFCNFCFLFQKVQLSFHVSFSMI